MTKVLLITPVQNDGTSFYRAFGPMNRLAKQFDDIEVIDGSTMSLDWAELSAVDVVVMQRPFASQHARLAELCNIVRVPLILDYDDDLFSVDKTNPAFKLYDNDYIKENIRYICNLADRIWVSTRHLADVFKDEKIKTQINVTPNAIDTEHFKKQNLKPRKVIAYRGGDSHKEDMEYHKEAILNIYHDFPEYEWAFFGYIPDYLQRLKRVKNYKFTNPMQYMRFLMEVRPEILIVPLRETFFNQSKSDIAFLEATVAGAITVAPKHVQAFGDHIQLWLYNISGEGVPTGTTFEGTLRKAIESDQKDELAKKAYTYLLTNRTLSNINARRHRSIKDVLFNYDTNVQIKLVEDQKEATEYEFYNYEQHMGISLDNEEYKLLVKEIVDGWVKDIKPENFLDIGCGCGIYVAEMLSRGVTAYGIEISSLHAEDWRQRFPNWDKHYINDDFFNVNFDGTVADLAICIEVLEHMTDEKAKEAIDKMGTLCKYLVFSSIPYSESPSFDKYWGHINLHSEEQWIDMFQERGFVLLKQKQKPAPWGMLFVNSNI